jgi:fatty-acyl-CoA synthase
MEPPALTFAEYVEARARDNGTGLLSGEERFTWAQVVAAAKVRARLARTMAPRTHIGVLLDNTPEYVF